MIQIKTFKNEKEVNQFLCENKIEYVDLRIDSCIEASNPYILVYRTNDIKPEYNNEKGVETLF